jgi:hypothetical protein
MDGFKPKNQHLNNPWKLFHNSSAVYFGILRKNKPRGRAMKKRLIISQPAIRKKASTVLLPTMTARRAAKCAGIIEKNLTHNQRNTHEAHHSLPEPVALFQEPPAKSNHPNQAGGKVQLCLPSGALWIEATDHKSIKGNNHEPKTRSATSSWQETATSWLPEATGNQTGHGEIRQARISRTREAAAGFPSSVEISQGDVLLGSLAHVINTVLL